MIINCSPYDRGDLIRTIEYAKKMKKEEYNQRKLSENLYRFDIEKLNRLINVLNGKIEYKPYLEMSKNVINNRPHSNKVLEEKSEENN